jgi:hypothetical protein
MVKNPRTLVVTIDATSIPDDVWPVLKQSVNHAVDRAIRTYCHDGAQVWRRSDDVSTLLEADE